MVLHKGEIAEMRTGEGKTLVAVLPAFLNALSGKSVHVVTVNDYLARRDCEWVGQVHRFLGLKVSPRCFISLPPPQQKAQCLAARLSFLAGYILHFVRRGRVKLLVTAAHMTQFNWARFRRRAFQGGQV